MTMLDLTLGFENRLHKKLAVHHLPVILFSMLKRHELGTTYRRTPIFGHTQISHQVGFIWFYNLHPTKTLIISHKLPLYPPSLCWLYPSLPKTAPWDGSKPGGHRDWWELQTTRLIMIDLCCQSIVVCNMTGWWLTKPLWKRLEFVNWDDDIPNIWENKIHVPNHQSDNILLPIYASIFLIHVLPKILYDNCCRYMATYYQCIIAKKHGWINDRNTCLKYWCWMMLVRNK